MNICKKDINLQLFYNSTEKIESIQFVILKFIFDEVIYNWIY